MTTSRHPWSEGFNRLGCSGPVAGWTDAKEREARRVDQHVDQYGEMITHTAAKAIESVRSGASDGSIIRAAEAFPYLVHQGNRPDGKDTRIDPVCGPDDKVIILPSQRHEETKDKGVVSAVSTTPVRSAAKRTPEMA